MTIKRARERSDNHGGDDDEQRVIIQIIAASAMVRAGLAALVGADERFIVSGSYSNAAEVAQELESALDRLPDAIITELSEASVEELGELTNSQEEETEAHLPALVVLVPDLQPELLTSLLRNGVRALLPRTATGEEIIAALEAAVAGLVVVHPDALEALTEMRAMTEKAAQETPPFDGEPLVESLTPREREVFGMIAEGLSNKEIAWRLKISEHTIKFHVSSILAKLGVSSRTEAVTEGLRRGLIML